MGDRAFGSGRVRGLRRPATRVCMGMNESRAKNKQGESERKSKNEARKRSKTTRKCVSWVVGTATSQEEREKGEEKRDQKGRESQKTKPIVRPFGIHSVR